MNLLTGNRTLNRYGRREFTHTVEGEVDGVPFCQYFKSPLIALKVARSTGGTVYCLLTLAGQRWNQARQRWDHVGPNQTKETRP